ncbi:hypothetical protein [Noviherbaspirillum malthae]|uniref:hypothetical protein n=1 Tax=Noviherbaspirillum malthae TaxID=1260987 RepID=UPI00188E9850|nr:hypothetical protein [Noviherbaspirillum malthae]
MSGFTIVPPIAVTDAVLTSSNVPENDFPVYSAASTYALDACVISTTTHRIYRSLQAANTGKPLPVAPATATDWWQDIGATNRWKMFDKSVQSQTVQANSVSASLTITGRASAVVLLNVSAASAHITMTSPTSGVVYDKTFSLLSDGGISDFYSWHFDERIRNAELVVLDLPPYSGCTITVELSDPGQTVKCGACIVGQAKEIGGTQFGARIGMIDYSVKTVDAFGNMTVTERPYSKRGGFTVWVQNTYLDQLNVTLPKYRATPIVYIGSPLYGSTVNYGFYKDYDTELSYPTESLLSINIEGLT